jgi:hypothetical protein
VADATNTPVDPLVPGAPEPAKKGGSGFLATTMGKIVVVAIALLVLAGIAGAIALMLAAGGVTGWLKSGSVSVEPASATNSSVATQTVPPVNPAEKPLTSTFTFRNIFAPSIKPPVTPTPETTETATTTSSSSTTTPTTSTTTSSTVSPASTLVLNAIVTVGDAHKGSFTLNGVPYIAGNGETIDSSPWKVLEVGTDSVLMLYGDDQVTIAVGQTISK